ncbi:hypothetical protein DMC64_24395 [Amycolatopsis sp. WAC 04197]|uniref:hypothetical protein n=1 Tax=Amycolatopsis sp. WAC 04197 TaxID=2203199 RepID=UPI000F7A47AB|nr:hypothetical protein [Amycolatopsis sp. WAC 04197]RSN42661.1 hypothetical protein DMC64_24395 [Amycolatopsis sp. WAC 04197]
MALLLALVSWGLSGWQMWPWLFGGVGGMVVMLLLGRGVPLAWRLTVPLLVVAVWLLTYVDPWWWAVIAGVIMVYAATVAAVHLRLRTRRWQTLGALAFGLAMVTAGSVMLAVNAAEETRQTQDELNAAHAEAVARILPRTPNALVWNLVVRLSDQATGGRQAAASGTTAAADFCFHFSPEAADAFATARGAADCPGAFLALAAEVTNPRDYVTRLSVPGSAVRFEPDHITSVVNACRLEFGSVLDDTPTTAPGPQLGELTLRQQLGQGHLVIGYQPCT